MPRALVSHPFMNLRSQDVIAKEYELTISQGKLPPNRISRASKCRNTIESTPEQPMEMTKR